MYGEFTSEGYNLVTTRGSSTGYIGSDLADGMLPNLGPLQDNGGPTLSFLPQAGSPVIDANSATACDVGASDQRGEPRPVGVGCDIGAVEVNDILFRNGFEIILF